MRAMIVLGVLLLTGCASGVAYRIPTVPLNGQTTIQIDHDTHVCEATAPPSMNERGLTYASCMIERGYSAWVEVPIWSLGIGGEKSTAYMVTPTTAHDAKNVRADVTWCGYVVDKLARPTVASRWSMATWGVLVTGVPFAGADTEAIDRVYKSCMEPRGYAVEVWRP